MATMTIEAILERVQELKNECQEKDEVIRDQQVQIMDLEEKMNELVARYKEQSAQIEQINSAANKADELMEKLSEVLG